MEVIGVGKGMLPTTARDLRSHHLRVSVNRWFARAARRYALDVAIFSGRHPKIFTHPDDALEGSLMGQAVGVF